MKYINLNKKGSVALVTVISVVAFLIFFMFFVGYIVTISSYITIDREVDTLADIAKQKGGLPSKDIGDFVNRILSEQPYLSGKEGEIIISLHTETGNIDCTNTADLGETGFYIDKTVNDIMVLEVIIPSNKQLLQSISTYLGSKNVEDIYNYKRHIVSVREKINP